MRKFLSFFSFLFVFSAISQVSSQPVKWHFNYHKINDTSGIVIFSAKIEKDWHIYSLNQKGDGPIATSIAFDNEDGYNLIGITEEPEPKSLFSEVFAMEVKSFSEAVDFKQKINIKAELVNQITGKLEFMACNETSCLPPKTIDFVVDLNK